jgi:hypothetical protein
MKIKMLHHYHGRLSGDTHMNPGTEHDVPASVGQELIDRGFAMDAESGPVRPNEGEAPGQAEAPSTAEPQKAEEQPQEALAPEEEPVGKTLPEAVALAKTKRKGR